MESQSPGRKLGKAALGSMSKSDRKSPSAKRIDNRYPQTRRGGKV